MKETEVYIIDKQTILITTEIYKIVAHFSQFSSLEGRLRKVDDVNSIDFDSMNITKLAFDSCDSTCFVKYLGFLRNKIKIDILSINFCFLDILDFVLEADHVIINEGVTVTFTSDNFINVREITFQDLKSFKGEFITDISSVESLIVWNDKNNIEKMIYRLPKITNLFVTKCLTSQLHLSRFKKLKRVELNYCKNIKNIEFNELADAKVVIYKCPLIEVPNTAPNMYRKK